MRDATTARPVDLGGMLGWLKARERKILLFTVAAQLLILAGMIALRAVPLVTGQTVLVRVEPVDPRDLFRGDYVILSYGFSRISRDDIEGVPDSEGGKSWKKLEGRPVYVQLVPDSVPGHHRAAKVTLVKPERGLFIKGQLEKYGSAKYGIESYFVQEGTGRVYEQAIRDRHLTAELAVASNGQAALRGLRIE
jgi:uncharacterized membrane-anchored protein